MFSKGQVRAWAAVTMAWTLAVLWSAGVRAGDLPVMPPAPDTFLVGDLLRADAERARAAERVRFAGLVSAPAAGAVVAPAIPDAGAQAAVAAMPVVAPVSLLAIYGVGTRLYADVHIQGQTVTYAAGRAQALGVNGTNDTKGTHGASAARTAYRLRAIRPPCVQLVQLDQGADKPALELCLGAEP